ncbi:MAG: AI-2E family transporter [Elusimicrobia bacterium]|nr:AI-2E family transporter [Elusimicrobiota bacterium]
MKTPAPRAVSWLLFAVLALLVVAFRLGPAVVAGFFAYTMLDVVHRRLAARTGPVRSRWLSLLAFLAAAAVMTWLSGRLLRESLTSIPDILDRALPRISELSLRYGIELPFDTTEELHQSAVKSLFENAHALTRGTGLLTKKVFRILMALLIAVFCFMNSEGNGDRESLYDAWGLEFKERIASFVRSFELILKAQVVISAINTCFTAVFLVVLDFPHAAFLVPITFVLGILPIVGNLLSNTIIIGAALAISLRHAALALAFLVLVHKGEYFLNSRIVGSTIQAPMWQTLLGILMGEALLGVPGIILAPAVLHYVRVDMQEIAAGG